MAGNDRVLVAPTPRLSSAGTHDLRCLPTGISRVREEEGSGARMRQAGRRLIVKCSSTVVFLSLMAFALGSSPSTAAPKTDTIVLVNGNAITGEVKRLDRGILSYSTDYMGTLNIEWDKVAQLRSTQLMEIE